MGSTLFKEYDPFRLSKSIADETLPVGTLGVVLMVLSDAPAAYEVEFLDSSGQNLGRQPTFTLDEAAIEPLSDRGHHP